MIITRTPFRISFFGGGTDFPDFFREHGGSVLSTTINHYCYITCRILPPFFDYNYSLRYSITERCKVLAEIKHHTIRECLKYLSFRFGIEVSHSGDLPANSGIGSSSAFCVGFLNALYGLSGRMMTKRQLAKQAIYVERDMVRENVGFQDQISTAFGGFNRIDFSDTDKFWVTPMIISGDRINRLSQNLVFVYTGIWRVSSEIAKDMVGNTRNHTQDLLEMKEQVDTAVDILANNGDLDDFGRLLHEGWTLKRSLSNRVSSPEMDEMYEKARKAGALGGKVCGAGGGGFFLFYIPTLKREQFLEQFKDFLIVPIQFETMGSHVVFFTSNEPYLDRKNSEMLRK